ncbi:hypothetical protein PUN28_011831 [Cardiocondyla obscurior]|uniref:Uncharacterized protein n=1 Tax=Cardiocondyla obscurior TaxID=286306 RepID=A0AAW2FHT2_9HYME
MFLFFSPSPHLPEEPEEVGPVAEDDSNSLPEPDFPESIPLPVLSVEFLGEQEEPRAIIDPLLELLRRTCTPWTDPITERAFTIGPDHFHPEKIRRQAIAASFDENFLIYYPRMEFPFLAPISLIDRVFQRFTARVVEIVEIDLG